MGTTTAVFTRLRTSAAPAHPRNWPRTTGLRRVLRLGGAVVAAVGCQGTTSPGTAVWEVTDHGVVQGMVARASGRQSGDSVLVAARFPGIGGGISGQSTSPDAAGAFSLRVEIYGGMNKGDIPADSLPAFIIAVRVPPPGSAAAVPDTVAAYVRFGPIASPPPVTQLTVPLRP